jgi:WD40 repeat protein
MTSGHSIPRSSTSQPAPIPQSRFAFPTNQHLLITTPSRILSWDPSGLHELFASSKSGIAAATESKDGSGILAIADRHTVVLHDTKRGHERSWGLSAHEDEVRHLQYTKDSKNLFLSTRDTNQVQCYSTEAQQLCSPPQTLASPAAALAISPTGHLMISAQSDPPVVFLKDLAKNSAATILKPQASASGIAIVAFHPERANIFTLAFDDGTLSIYDASRMSRGMESGRNANQHYVGKGEIGRIDKLHHAVRIKDEGGSRAITGAAFIPGHKLRMVTVGIDGRCKLVDFSEGAKVLRTWHARAPLTSLSVLAASTSTRASGSRKGKAPVRSTNYGAMIAVGTQNGNVLLYDTLGLLQSRREISATGERIISVEWVHGPSPRCTQVGEASNMTTMAPTMRSPSHERTTKNGGQSRSTPKHLSIHPALRPSTMNPIASPSLQMRRFTVHPDETADDSTVRHTPNGRMGHAVNAEAEEYLDLFSPVNPFAAEQTRLQREKSYSPTRNRPRISSQTFNKSPAELRNATAIVSSARTPKLLPTVESHATSSESTAGTVRTKRHVQLRSAHATKRGSPLKSERRRIDRGSVRKPAIRRTDGAEVVDATAAANARLLRDLRLMSTKSCNAQAGSVLQGYASKTSKKGRPGVDGPQSVGARNLSTDAPQQKQPIVTQVFGTGGRWPTDSVDEESWSDEQQDDIWITSDEERKQTTRRHQLFQRPAARQTSRSRMNSGETMSTAQTVPRSPTSAHQAKASAPNIMNDILPPDDDTLLHSRPSPDVGYTLASDDVQSLFPRTSSKSPRNSKKDPNCLSQRSPQHRKTALQELASNAALPLPLRPIDPWAKVQKTKTSPPKSDRMADPADHAPGDHVAQPHARGEACGGCAANAAKVMVLEGEVSHMKGEILALRAMLRRNGIPMPAIPRG